jgi:hypothetical protein
MKAFSKLTQPGVMFVAALALVLTMAPVSSFATAKGQVARNLFITTTTAECCVILGPTVKINEPVTVAPVIVTWSADYIVSDTVQFALSLNGGLACFTVLRWQICSQVEPPVHSSAGHFNGWSCPRMDLRKGQTPSRYVAAVWARL